MVKFIYLLVLFLILITNQVNSQVVIGTVTDSDYHPINNAIIQDTFSKTTVTSDNTGSFILTTTNKSVLQISQINYEPKIFLISTNQQSDTIYLNFILNRKIQLVPEVVVSSDRMKKIVDQNAINVIDYIPFNDYVLTLKSSKSQRLLSLEGMDTTYQEFKLGGIKPKSLFEDCFGNIHLLTKDSAYQIWIDSTLHFIATASIEKFTNYIKLCSANFSDYMQFYSFSNHNRKYTITTLNKQSKQKETLFQLHDKIGERVARSYYYSIISYYYRFIPEYANMIELGVWDGNVLTLNFSDPEFDQMVIWYLKIRAVELNIKAFQANNELVLFDQFSDSIKIYNDQNQNISSKSYAFKKGSTVFDVIQDRYLNIFYELTIDNGIYSLCSIDIQQNGHLTPNCLTIKEVPFADNIKIYNDWVYFLLEENNYHGIYKIKISKQ